MHHDDSGMSEHGDMFWNRRKGNILLGMMARILFKFGKKERFKPDLYIDEGYDLSEYGLNAKFLHIPGHSKGSIGILTADGDLFLRRSARKQKQTSSQFYYGRLIGS